MEILEEDLVHYGIIRKSGRYPWGSGGNVEQRSRSFLDYIRALFDKGFSEKQVADAIGEDYGPSGFSTSDLRAAKTIAVQAERAAKISQAQRLKEKGWSNVAIGERMGLNESSVRSLLAPGAKLKNDQLTATADRLMKEVDNKTLVDVGAGNELYLGVSSTKLNTAIRIAQENGYQVYYVKVPQLGTGKETTVKVLAPEGMTYSEVYKRRGEIQLVQSHSDDGGETWVTSSNKPLQSVDPKRVQVIYGEEGGADADGVIYLRRGVEDLDMGSSSYAQVRIQVGDGHYLKGMAMYKDDMPDGVDIMFNTNKKKTDPKIKTDLDAMKELESDPDNPFGSNIRRQNGALNIVNEEGRWSEWSRTLSSQMLSKQDPRLAQEQLNQAYEDNLREYDEIMRLTNPTVRRTLLAAYADQADAAAVHLKAAALPRQANHVILPINTLKDNEIYAPGYKNGERVVLIRHPHGGTFEIPELVVNNNHPDARRALGQAVDAVGINSRVAERLSGADFDGDTVLVIPNNSGKVKTSPALDGLKDFDPRTQYAAYPGMKPMTEKTKQIQMGDVSNLITDMTIRGAPHHEIAAAVRHSMVVIDAEKHKLNYRQSYIDNGIAHLKEKYQGSARSGATTLISRASSPKRVPERKERPAAEGGPIDPKTGKKVYVETGKEYVNKKGEVVKRTSRTTQLGDVDDAFELSSGTRMEAVYARHSNKLKGQANRARAELVKTPRAKYSPSAKKAFATEVEELDTALRLALRNAPRERQAQVLANANVRLKQDHDPSMSDEMLKKVRSQELERARIRTGAKKTRIDITPRQWEAIQAGAISDSKLSQILANADMDRVKELATPRTQTTLSSAKVTRARRMLASGFTRAEIAQQLGVSLGTLDSGLYGDE